MRIAYRFIVALMLLPLPALAQQTPRVEVFGGYSHLVGNFSNSDFNLNGADFSVTENLNKWLGGTLDFSSHFGTVGGFKVNSETIMYGPLFAYRKNPSVVPFGHVLLGAVRGGPEYLGISDSEYRFGVLAGGGVDLKMGKRVSLRIIQADYLMTRFSSSRQDNIRLSAGIVLRFGQK
ncbi:MAG TPA: outer membrane beta-barrel protein [Terriglobia bacterium]|nr:outer membrane beta-barrel protein [Terriglobia bacterium]